MWSAVNEGCRSVLAFASSFGVLVAPNAPVEKIFWGNVGVYEVKELHQLQQLQMWYSEYAQHYRL